MSKKDKDKKNILQRDLNPKEILAVLGVVGIMGAYGFIFIDPKYSDYKLAKNNLVSIESRIIDYENKVNEMPILQEKLDSLTSEINVKSRKLAHNMEDGMFLIGLSKVMDDFSVDLVNYSMEEAVPYERFYGIPTTIEVRGNYRNIREIMYYMEEQKNITQILDYSVETYIEEKENINNVNDTSDMVNEKPKSTGEVLATFKFVMYSSDNPILDLNNDDISKWGPGKWNPFTTTTR